MCLDFCQPTTAKNQSGIGYKVMRRRKGDGKFVSIEFPCYTYEQPILHLNGIELVSIERPYDQHKWIKNEVEIELISVERPHTKYISGFHIYTNLQSALAAIKDYDCYDDCVIVKVQYRNAKTQGWQFNLTELSNPDAINCVVAQEMYLKAVYLTGSFFEDID